VVYPREAHSYRDEKHLLDRLNRILAWYHKSMKETSPAVKQAEALQN
jgi:dipeptidyl aminopeptidase/acylaminoacyl peptidase